MKNTMFGETTASIAYLRLYNKEVIWRELAIKMIKEMPFDKLSKVFTFSDFDPESLDPNDLSIAPRLEEYNDLKKRGLVKLYAIIRP
jgi:hypothetical protein